MMVKRIFRFLGCFLLLSYGGYSAAESALNNTIYSQDIDVFKQLIAQGTNVNEFDPEEGLAPIHIALYNQSTDFLLLIIEHGGDVNLLTSDGVSPLEISVSEAEFDTFELLIEAGAKYGLLNSNGNSFLQQALSRSQYKIAQWLISKEEKINFKAAVVEDTEADSEDDWYTDERLDYPLFLVLDMFSSKDSYLDEDAETELWANTLLQGLLDAGVIFNIVDNAGDAAIFNILESKNTDLINTAIASLSNLNVVDDFDNSPLLSAIKMKLPDVAHALVNKTVNLEQADKIGMTAIQQAYKTSMFELVTEMLEVKPQTANQLWRNDQTLFHQALLDGHIKSLKSWLKLTKLYDIVSEAGDSLLHIAITNNDFDTFKWLVKRASNTMIINELEQTPVSLAIEKGARKFIKPLLNKVDKSHLYKDKQTLLHLAAKFGDISTVKTLVKAGYNITDRDVNGMLAAHIAISYGHAEVLDYLVDEMDAPSLGVLSDGADVFNDPRVEYWSLLYWADKKKALLKSVEKDLASGTPSILAAKIWTVVNHNLDVLESSLAKTIGDWNGVVNVSAQVTFLNNKSRYQEMIKQFPADYNFSKQDLFAIVTLANAADSLKNYSLKYDYLEVGIRLMPSFWQFAWSYQDMAQLNQPALHSRALLFANSDEIAGQEVSAYLKAMLKQKQWGSSDRTKKLKKWMELSPNDPRLNAAQAYALKGTSHFAEALTPAYKAIVSFPFYGNRDLVPELLLKLGHQKQARAHLAIVAKWYQSEADDESLPARIERYMGDAYQDTSDKGNARQTFEAALQKWPTNYRLKKALASLETGDGRHAQAAELYKSSIELDPEPDSSDYRNLFQALVKSGEKREAVELATKLLASELFIKENFYKSILDVANETDNQVLVSQVLEKILAVQPEDVDNKLLQAKYAWQNSDKDEARTIVDKLINIAPYNTRVIKAWSEYTPSDEILGKITARLDTQQNNHELWKLLIKHSEFDFDEKLATWQEANKANNAAFAVGDVMSLYVDAKKYQQGIEFLSPILASMDNNTVAFSQSNKHEILVNSLWLIENFSKRERLTPAVQNQFKKNLEKYKENNFNLANYYRYLESYYLAVNDKKEAAKAMYQRSLISKDNTGIYHDLVKKYSGELSKIDVQGYGYRMLQRNPYSKSTLSSYLHKQLLWGGSSINALKAMDSAEKRGVEFKSSYERRALNDLGDTLKLYENYRVLGHSPGVSKRYVNWYERARKDALSNDRKEILYDFSQGNSQVNIVEPNGEITYRSDHPVFGVVTQYRKGATWMEIGYDEVGNMTSIHDSGGEFVNLIYDGDNHISRMENSKDQVLEFTYNTIGKPIVIDLLGLGSIHVSYDDDGEILKINSEHGHRMALKVTQAFQDLLKITKRVQNIYRSGTLPQMNGTDQQLEELKQAYSGAKYGSQEQLESQLSLAEYLVEHVTDNASYAYEADELLSEIYDGAQQSSDATLIGHGVSAVSLWHKLFKEFKPYGLPKDDFARWSEMRLWLAAVSYSNKKYKHHLKAADADPLQLLKDAHWLARSDINNSAFWQRFGNQDIYPSQRKNIEKQALLVRRNGDIILGTTKGLGVLRAGFWEWYGYDDNVGKFDLNLSSSSVSKSSNILSLAETNDGVLWVGSANGLYAITKDYDSELKRWRTKGQGLDSPRINTLVTSDNFTYVGTPKGLVRVTLANDIALSVGSSKNQIDALALVNLGNVSASGFVLSKNTLQLMSEKGETTQVADNVTTMAYSSQNERLYWLEKSRLYAASVLANDEGVYLSEKQFLGSSSDLLHSKAINELQVWHVPGAGTTLVVNTDLGTNVLKDYYFQSMSLPFEVSRGGSQVGPTLSVTADNGDIVVATDEGIYTYLPSGVKQYAVGRVYDTLTDEKLGITYLARGNDIMYLDNNDKASEPQFFSSDNAKILTQDIDGNLITHSGNNILRYKRGKTSPQQLFSAYQNVEEDKWQGEINDIFVDSRNTIWVAAGSSVFRYSNDMPEPQEFNYFIDSELFPSRSQMIYRIYENLQNKIQVVASDEGHLDHLGVRLSGGLLEWQDGKFVNLGHEGNWFATGYTKINEDTAIVGNNGDFSREKFGVRQSYVNLNDPTYLTMKEKSPMIWLGQQGVQLGEQGTWLFPTAGGLVVYHQGKWFYPDRINQLLPQDQALGQYGARTVHSVSVDKQDKVYVATDLGLLVYESHGVASMLNDNHQGQVAFDDFNIEQQQKVNDIFLSKLDLDSKQGKLMTRYQALQQEIEQIETSVDLGINMDALTNQAAAIENDDNNKNLNNTQAEALKKQLKKRERSRQKLLANLEKNHFGLFQMLKMDPREISAMHKKLSKTQALVQYLPTRDKLVIQVVTSEGAVIRQVEVSQEKLFEISMQSAATLRQQTEQLDLSKTKRGMKVKQGKKVIDAIEIKADSHVDSLRWLYHHLIRPIENDLQGKEQIFITPVGALTYVPFSALIRSVKPKIEYLAQRYNVGILPSMYHFNLVMQQAESYSEKALFIADPDGTLPGAREEVQQISTSYDFEKTILEGDEASMDNMENELEESRIIHFATHGLLDSVSPGDSYLMLANGYQLGVIDISTMDLEQTDLVVLSACESGIGGHGLEYATLARAFAHAKVPSVVASYWMVHDDATKTLMNHMYLGLGEQELDHFTALSYAKQKMIAAGGKYSHPAAWASFEVFGKP